MKSNFSVFTNYLFVDLKLDIDGTLQEVLEKRLIINNVGRSKTWEHVSNMTWLSDFFFLTEAIYPEIEQSLIRGAKRFDSGVVKIVPFQIGILKFFHVDLVQRFYRKCLIDENFMKEYRIDRLVG